MGHSAIRNTSVSLFSANDRSTYGSWEDELRKLENQRKVAGKAGTREKKRQGQTRQAPNHLLNCTTCCPRAAITTARIHSTGKLTRGTMVVSSIFSPTPDTGCCLTFDVRGAQNAIGIDWV